MIGWLKNKGRLISKNQNTLLNQYIQRRRIYLFHEHQRDGGQQGNDRHDGKLIADRANATLQLGVRIHEFFGFVSYQNIHVQQNGKY